MSVGGYLKLLALGSGVLMVSMAADCTPVGPPEPLDKVTVVDPNDGFGRGKGDEVSLGRIEFHATYGVAGSSVVTVDNRFGQIAGDVDQGETIDVPDDLGRLGRMNFGGAPVVDWEDNVIAGNAPIVVSGSIAVALELDAIGDRRAQAKIESAGEMLRAALDHFIAGPNGQVDNLASSLRLLVVAQGLYCVQAILSDNPLPPLCPRHPEHPEWEAPETSSPIGRWFFNLFFGNTGHDLIGIGAVISLNLSPGDFDSKMQALRDSLTTLGLPADAVPSCGGAAQTIALCPPQEGQLSLHLYGEDAYWRLDTNLLAP